jgi:polygalacturonase
MKKVFFLLFITGGICYSTACKASILDDNDSTLTIAPGDTALQTTYIQNAINYCNSTGGGTVRLTAGSYYTAPITLKSNVTLRIDSAATLFGSTNMADWSPGGSLVAALITTSGNTNTNITITGKGTIDGSGAAWWAAYNANNSFNRPYLIKLSNVTNLTIDSITVQNSPMFHIEPTACTNVIIDHVTINTINTSPNTDGIDPSVCKNVLITNCSISDGDDCIAIKSGRESGKIVIGSCQDITIANCTFGYGHGVSIGSETDNGFLNLRVTGCTFNKTTNGIRVKSYPGAGGLCENLYYSNITMTGVTNPIVIDMDYSGDVGSYATDIPSVNGLYINNLTSTGSSNDGTITGTSGSLVQNINFSNVSLTTKSGGAANITIAYAAGVKFSNVVINGSAASNGGNVITTNVTGTSGF